VEIFDYVIIMLAAVILSNLINRFIPLFSPPMVQIILGVLIAMIPFGTFGFEFNLEPELFFVLFLSPLVFQSTMTADKRTMVRMIKPIITASIGLVIVNIFIIGYLTHLLVPAFSLSASLILAAALGPTDFVAVESVGRRVKLPRKIISILSNESIINDATGIVCFQFAIIAASESSVNLFQGVVFFVFVGGGGILVGLILTVLKYMLVRWLRSLRINAISLHIAIGIMTPFIIFMVADNLGVSGIMAVFVSGLLHSLFWDRFNPEVITLNNAQEHVWSVVSFSLDGLVFVMLGTQLPRIMRVYTSGSRDIQGYRIAGYVVLITTAVLATRFAWWALTVKKKTYSDPKKPIGKIKSSLIFAIGGARGAVSMASALSIPLMLQDDTSFPEREMIILITASIIVISMLLTNFILPLLAEEKKETARSEAEEATYAEILQTVENRLKNAATPENFAATEVVIRNYHSRMSQHPGIKRKTSRARHRWNLQRDILLWEKDIFLRMAEMEQISKATAEHYIKEADKLIAENKDEVNPIHFLPFAIKHFIKSITWRGPQLRDKDIQELEKINARMMRKTLRGLQISENDPIAAIIAAEHEKVVSTRMGFKKEGDGNLIIDHRAIHDVAANGFYMERTLIEQMLEAGRLTWKTAKEMQANITMIEAQFNAE